MIAGLTVSDVHLIEDYGVDATSAQQDQEREPRLGSMRKLVVKVYSCYEETEMDRHDGTVDRGHSIRHIRDRGVDDLDERGLFICLEKCVLDQITGLGLWPSL
jgi:hypothetical protein